MWFRLCCWQNGYNYSFLNFPAKNHKSPPEVQQPLWHKEIRFLDSRWTSNLNLSCIHKIYIKRAMSHTVNCAIVRTSKANDVERIWKRWRRKQTSRSSSGQAKFSPQMQWPHFCNTYQLFKHVNFQTKNIKKEKKQKYASISS